MDPWVYEYSKDNTSSQTQWHAQTSKVDIAEPNMDEEVHGFASDNVETLPWKRTVKPNHANGSGPQAFPASLH